MSPDPTIRHVELRKSIRTLTSLLQKFEIQKSPSKQPREILPFLNHFTTLLTCGEPDDNQAKRVIAVTGSIDHHNRVRTLVVAQNPRKGSALENVSLELIKKDKRSLAEVLDSPPNPSLSQHIADVWVALSAFTALNPNAPEYRDQIASLELFFLSRSFRKFESRFKEDKRLCGDKKRLYQVIREWKPNRAEIPVAKWVEPPAWLLQFQGLPKIKSRKDKQQIRWEFSDDTIRGWSEILAIILQKVDAGIAQVKSFKGNKKTQEDLRQAMITLNVWCRTLYYFVVWDAGIVKSLLTETTIVTGITTIFMPIKGNGSMGEAEDEIGELRPEPDETKGQQVFRYLKTAVAWHAAVHSLSRNKILPELLNNLEIGLVEAPSSSTNMLTLTQVVDGLSNRFPLLNDHSKDVLKELQKYYSNVFTGCVHAEATLMGLVNYYTNESTYVNQRVLLKNEQNVRRIIQPVADAGNAVIAVSKKCCWCCDWLGQNIETKFKLPGTHGIMYAWDPPTVGVSASVLQRLEEVLWEELHEAVAVKIETSYSRHSSAASSLEGMHGDEMFSYVLKV